MGGLAMVSLVGCSTGSSAPFHMYGSPLLEGDLRAQRAQQSSYDPFRMGDHRVEDRVIVHEQKKTLPQTAAPRAAVPAGPPALSAPRASPPHTGASEGIDEESARPAGSSESAPANAPAPSAVSGDEGAALAAEFVASVYVLNGVELPATSMTSITELYRTCRDKGTVYHSSRPTVGDLVFFHNTFDANGDGRNNDWYTHVALVESIGRNGTAAVLSYQDGQVQRHHLNLERSDAATMPGGGPANSSLRAKQAGDPPFTQYLAGQLFAGFCSLLGDQAELVLVDNWKPGMNLSR